MLAPSDTIEWEFCSVFFRRKLLDGTMAAGHLMRRRVRGVWQYRKMTFYEEAEWLSLKSW